LHLSYQLAYDYWYSKHVEVFNFEVHSTLPNSAIQSVEMKNFLQLLDPSGFPDCNEGRFSNWLMTEWGSLTASQKFSRSELSLWLVATKMKSAYRFSIDATGGNASDYRNSTSTPEEWRANVAKVLSKHNGNKAHAAKELGISRARVGQLVSSPGKVDRKPLTLSAQDPFGMANKSPSNKRS
jgi:hypothetical protein